MEKPKRKRDTTSRLRRTLIGVVIVMALVIVLFVGFGIWMRNLWTTETDLSSAEARSQISYQFSDALLSETTDIHGVRVSYFLSYDTYLTFHIPAGETENLINSMDLPCELELESNNGLNIPSIARDWWRPQDAETFRAGQCETTGRTQVFHLWLDETDPATTVIYMVEEFND